MKMVKRGIVLAPLRFFWILCNMFILLGMAGKSVLKQFLRNGFVFNALKTWRNWLFLTGVFLIGCSTTELPQYHAQPFDTYEFSESNQGLAIALHPLTNQDESEKYFGQNLLTYNILAIFIVAENKSTTSTFLLSNENFQLGGGNAGGPSEDPEVTTPHPGAVLSLGAFPILLPLAGAMLSEAAEIEHNFLAKEFQAETLSPGKKTEGFVYFQLPEKQEDWPQQWILHVEALEVKKKDTISLTIPFSWRTK